MISKNIDFYKQKNVQLSVTRVSGQANVSYGEFDDFHYKLMNNTKAIKKFDGKPKNEKDINFYLNSDEIERNLIPFSFQNDKILTLTCSLAFDAYRSEEGEGVMPKVPSVFRGVEDCFFQEKTEKELNFSSIKDLERFRFSDKKRPPLKKEKGDSGKSEIEDLKEMREVLLEAQIRYYSIGQEFIINGSYKLLSVSDYEKIEEFTVFGQKVDEESDTQEFKISEVTSLNEGEIECEPCPIIVCDIDIPIYGFVNGDGIQFFKGPISFESMGTFYDNEEFSCEAFCSERQASRPTGCFSCEPPKNDKEKDFITCINIYQGYD